MIQPIRTLFKQTPKLSSLVVLGVSAVWILFAWVIADHFLTSQLQNLISVETAALERQSVTVTEAVGQHLEQLHGAAQVLASKGQDVKVFTLADIKKPPAKLGRHLQFNTGRSDC